MKKLLLALVATCILASAQAEIRAKAWIGLVDKADPALSAFLESGNANHSISTTAEKAVAFIRSSRATFAEYALTDGQQVELELPFLDSDKGARLSVSGFKEQAHNGACIHYKMYVDATERSKSGESRPVTFLSNDNTGTITMKPVSQGYLVLVLALPTTP